MNEFNLKTALDTYTKDLVPTILEILEYGEVDQKLRNMVKSAIWNQKDASLNKLRDLKTINQVRKEANYEPLKGYPKTNQENYRS